MTNDWGLNLLRPAVWKGTLLSLFESAWVSADKAQHSARQLVEQQGPAVRHSVQDVLSRVERAAPRKVDSLDRWVQRTAPHVQVGAPTKQLLQRLANTIHTRWNAWTGYIWLPPEDGEDEFDMFDDETSHVHAPAVSGSLWGLGIRHLRALAARTDGVGPVQDVQAHKADKGEVDSLETGLGTSREAEKFVSPAPTDGPGPVPDTVLAIGGSGHAPVPVGSSSSAQPHLDSHLVSQSHARHVSEGESAREGQVATQSPLDPKNEQTLSIPIPLGRGEWPSIPSVSVPLSSLSLSLPSSLSSLRIPRAHPARARPALLRDISRGVAQRFHVVMYVLAIAIDLLLRFTWSIKMSSHLQHLLAFEGAIALLELGEILRRFMWLIFRVEWEFARLERARGGLWTHPLPPIRSKTNRQANPDPDPDPDLNPATAIDPDPSPGLAPVEVDGYLAPPTAGLLRITTGPSAPSSSVHIHTERHPPHESFASPCPYLTSHPEPESATGGSTYGLD